MAGMSSPQVLESLAADAVALGDGAARAVLGIAGTPGAGKSTLVELLLARIGERRGAGWAAHVPMDGFHLADDQLRRLGLLDRKGAPETFDPAGYAHLLERVRAEIDTVVAFGKSPQAARSWVARVDQPNAELVSRTADAADRVVVNGAHGWADSAWLR